MALKEDLLVLLCILPIISTDNSWEDEDNARAFPKRIIQLMINYNEKGAARIKEITGIRAKYEETPHFELGYVMSEILERYRKMVGHVKKPIDYISDVVIDAISQTEQIQKLFLEIYHLVNMLNEIPRKYGHMREFVEEYTVDRSQVEEAHFKILENNRNRERERKKRQKEMKKQRDLYIKGEIDEIQRKPKKPPNKWWPIDYGWEIDYYWR